MEFKQFRDTKYFVSPEGVVTSRYAYGGYRGKSSNKERIVGRGKSAGYLCVKTRRGDCWYVHQMVMELYGNPCPGKGYVIDHIDENKLNNNISNLQWLLRGENVSKSTLITRRYCVLTTEQANEIRTKYKPRHYTRKQLAAEYGVSEGTIKDVISGRYY
jgi:hypothetical protein